MRLLQQIKLTAVIGIAALALSACSSHHATDADGAAGAAGGEAVTGGMGQEGGTFLGDSYSTNAPANQKYYFDFDKSEVHQEYMPSITAQAKYLASNSGARVRLEGNTDETGSREYNVALGERRADAVSKVLEANGVPSKQVVVVSYGEERPAATGHDEASNRLNRRVDFLYESK